MANGNFFAFLAGVAAGAALIILANTEKGEEVIDDLKEKGTEAFENGRAAVLNGLDKLEDKLSDKMSGAAPKPEEA
ncbi:MAG: YtxH domain-containing protein [Bacteroidales bacterium]|nr:YtxH domain-containing protein [Bacteroidales bacterium]